MADNLLQDSLAWMQSPQRTQAMQGVGGMLSSAINKLKQSSDADYANAQQFISNPLNASPELMSQITNQGVSLSGFAPVGMIVGRGAEGMASLAKQADLLAKQGIPEYKITELTGLEKVPTPNGFDWGKQISDKGATIRPDVMKNMTLTNRVRLEDLLDHPELYQKYPELKELKVEDMSWFWRDWGAQGIYRPKDNAIELKKDWAFDADPIKERTSTLLHEIQHAIQKKENWPGGTNPSWFNKESSKTIQRKLWAAEDSIAKEAAKLSETNVSRFTISNVLNYLGGNTKVVSKNDAEFIKQLQGNPDLGELVKRFQSFDGIREKLANRSIKANRAYESTMGETQARAITNQFDTGREVVPLTKNIEYQSLGNALIATDPFGRPFK
jgi:hypothetical protein